MILIVLFSVGPVHIPPELKLFGELANFISKTEQSNIPADLLEKNQLLSIYPIRRQAAASTAAVTTAASTEMDFVAEEFYDYVDKRHQNTFPRWQNFPFSAESIQVRG
jgi:hypothetical protein